nr:nucleoside-diphosphate sugar epimerase/dehydratase [uncultured Allomuricauda sp.]
MRIFISYSVSKDDHYLIVLFLEKLRENGHIVETTNLDDEFSLFRQQRNEYRIANADIFIGIGTCGGNREDILMRDYYQINDEKTDKILLVENGVSLELRKSEYFEFNRHQNELTIDSFIRNDNWFGIKRKEPERILMISIAALLLALKTPDLVSKEEDKVKKNLSHSILSKLSDWFKGLPFLKNRTHVLIYGTGQLAVSTLSSFYRQNSRQYDVIGFIEDNDTNTSESIMGIRVFERDMIESNFLKRKNISEIIVAVQNLEFRSLFDRLGKLLDLPVQLRIVPSFENETNKKFETSEIKELRIEDLLERGYWNGQDFKVLDELKDKNIFVTGGAGSIGSEIVRQIAKYDYGSLIIIDQVESSLYDLQQELKQLGYHNFIPIIADINDKNHLNKIFSKFKPDIIFHSAAYKHVPLMEYNRYQAIRVNIGGTKVIADLAVTHNVKKFVFISTDKAVNPTNVMGASKRIAEMYISCLQQEGGTKFITTRFGNVLGSNGSVIPLFKRQIEKGGPLTVTHKDITRYFMTIPEASQLVLEAGAMGQGGEIFIFDMGDSVKIFDLAKNMIKLSGLRYPEDIDIKITGLRPGEKLYEELLANGENTLPTYHKKIMISKVRDIDYKMVRAKIDELCVTNLFFEENTLKLMKEIVPEYVSNTSSFSRLEENTKSETKNPDISNLIKKSAE